MKATEKKEITQVFEFEKAEVIECFGAYLKAKNIIIPEKAQYAFEVKVNAMSRDIQLVKLITKLLEEGPASNGKGSEELKGGNQC